MRTPRTIALCLALATSLTAFGHVTVVPVRADKGATQTYTFRVPSEGGRTTTGLVLTLPKGVTVLSVAIPKEGSVAFQRKTDGEPDQIVWTLEIKPAAVVQLALTATNAPEDGPMIWKVTQKYADGTSTDWTPKTTLGPLDDEPAPAVPAPSATVAPVKK
jgi:hypothetical protein